MSFSLRELNHTARDTFYEGKVSGQIHPGVSQRTIHCATLPIPQHLRIHGLRGFIGISRSTSKIFAGKTENLAVISTQAHAAPTLIGMTVEKALGAGDFIVNQTLAITRAGAAQGLRRCACVVERQCQQQ